jgi:SP family general alpha glucoside:H+ symporter-like MFS transporter
MMSDLPTETGKAVQHSHLEAVTSPNEKMGEAQIVEQAKEATEIEHTLSVMECVKNYPMAIFWSIMVSMCVVMEGLHSTSTFRIIS